jgi:hypothetical protein
VTEIHIRIECKADGFPTPSELASRHAVENALLEADVGQIVDSGSGRGVMDIFVEVVNAAEARLQIIAILEDLGLASRAKVSAVQPRPTH